MRARLGMFLMQPQPAEADEDGNQQQHGQKIADAAAAIFFDGLFFQKRHGDNLTVAVSEPRFIPGRYRRLTLRLATGFSQRENRYHYSRSSISW